MRAIRWATVAAVAWLVIVHGLPTPRLVRSVQQQLVPVSAACKASFDREFTLATPQRDWSGSFTWVTNECPNGRLQFSARARDAAGNVTEATREVNVLNLDRMPLTRVYGVRRLFPAAGYLELAVSDAKRRQFGLSPDESRRFQWSIAVQFGRAMVIESSQVMGTWDAPRGTLLRVAVSNGTVRYERNGVEIYRSAVRMTNAAYIELAVEDASTALGYLVIAGGS